MSNKVDAALKAREERRKKELEELKKKHDDKISSALAARKERIKNNPPSISPTTNTGSSAIDSQKGAQGWSKYLADEKAKTEAIEAKEKEKPWWEKLLGYLGTTPDTSLTMGTTSQVVNYLREDESYKRPSDDWSIEQQHEFGALYLESPERAYEYAAETNAKNNKAKEEAQIKAIQDSATDNVGAGVVNTLGAIVTAPLGLADFLTDLTYASAGRDIAPDGIVTPFEYSQAVTEGIGTHLNETGGTINENIPIIGGKGWGDVYSLGTSIAQSAASAYTLGGAGTLVSYFGQGAASGVDDAMSRGATEEQAILYGTALGTFEGLAEKIGVDNLFKLGGSTTVKGVIKDILKQAGAEGAEEGLTSLFSNIADNAIMQDKSNFNSMVQAYMAQGMSESDAKTKAWMASVEGIAFDTIAGAVSGGVHAGFHTGIGSAIANHKATKTYGGFSQELVDIAREIGTEDTNRLAAKYQPRLDAGKNLTGAQLRMLNETNEQGYRTNDTAKIASAAEARLAELGESGDVKTIASILAKQVAGEKLSPSEKAMITNSKKGQRVANELNRKNILSGEYTSDWVQDIGTDRINSDVYNLAEEVSGVSGLEGRFTLRNGEIVSKGLPVAKYDPKTGTVSFTAEEGVYEDTPESEDAVGAKFEASDSGKTIYKDTDVTIEGIADVKDGDVILRLDNGETAKASEVSFGSHDEALVYEMVARMGVGAETANELVSAFAAAKTTPAAMYAIEAPLAYQYGRIGFERGLADLTIPDAQKRIAYNRGRLDAMTEASQNPKASVARKSEKPKKNGIIFEDENTYNEKSATDIQKASIKGIETLTKLSPTLEFHVYRSEIKDGKLVAYIDGVPVENAPNGFFTQGNKIYIDLNAGKNGDGVMLYTLSHEISHYIRRWNAKGFKVLGDFLLEQYGESDAPVDEFIKRQKAKIKNRLKMEGKAIPSETKLFDMAYEELVADAMSTMLADPKAYDKLAELKMENPSVFKKLGEAIKKILEKLKSLLGIYSERAPDAKEAGAVMEFAPEVYEKLQDLYLKAFVEAEANHESAETALGENDEIVKAEEVKFSERYQEAETNSEILSMIERVDRGEFKANEKVYLGTVSEKTAKQIYGLTGIRVDGYKVAIEARQIEHILKDHGKEGLADKSMADYSDIAKMEYALNAPDDITSAGKTQAYTHMVNGRNRTVDTVLYEKSIGEKSYYVVQAVPDTKAKTLYIVTAFIGKKGYKKEASQLINAQGLDATAKTGSANASANSISQKPDSVKRENSDRDSPKNSDRDPYSYDTLTSKPDMKLTTVGGNVPSNRADVVAAAKKNAAKVGEFHPQDGSVSVRVEDIDTDVVLGRDGLKHSLDRRFDVNAPVVVKAGEILRNSIRINELTPQKPKAEASSVLIGAAKNDAGDLYIVRSVVNRFTAELESMDVLYAINAKKESAVLNAPLSAGSPALGTDSTISIAQLLDYVNRFFPDILPESVLRHFGYDARPEGDLGKDALYSDRDEDSISTRSLLANALEGAAQNDIERQKLAQYKEKLSLIEAEQAKLSEIRLKIRELSFAKGPRDTEQIRSLQLEEKQAANRINTYDRQLLNLQATTALKNVLEREKKMAYDKAKREGKQALADYRERVATTQRELITRWQDSRKKAVEGRNKTEMRHKIKDIVKELDTLLCNPTSKKHIKEELRKGVAEALLAINMDTVGADERVAKYDALIARATDPDVIAELTATRDRIQLQGDNLKEKLDALRTAYERIKDSEDIELSMSYQEVIRNSIENVSAKVGNTSIRNMTLEQLEMVYDLFKMIRHTVRVANKAFKAKKGETIMQMAEAVTDQVRTVGGQPYKRNALLAAIQRVGWTFLKPFVAFRTIGSVTLTNLYKELRVGEDTFFGDVSAAQAFIEDQYKKHGFKSWNMKETKTFTAKSGKSFDLTLEQMMSLYAYSRREQAHDHIIDGGIVFEDAVITEKKHGLPVKYEVTTKDAFNLSEETLDEIVNSLTAEQKAFVEEMQAYLSDTMGAKGNEVSMELLGVKLFKEKFYLPIKSSADYMNFKPEEAGEIKLKSPAFSKETVKHANNPIVLHNFTDLWAEHINNMSMYHSFVLALEDFTRVFNYKMMTEAKVETMSTRATLETAYPGVTKYITNFLKSLNGGVRMDTVGFAEKMTSLAKKGAVTGSWSVMIQQPSAVMRAMAHINPIYFATTAPKSINLLKHKQDWEELKKYAPIAGIKEMGRFDVGMGKDTVDWIKSNGGVMAKADDILSFGPAFMDEVTWVSIWNAVKRETMHKHKSLSPKTEEFFKIAGHRFTEVVSLTQVYDSVFSRSDLMRNKSWIAKALTAFMAEPITTLNMIWDGWVQAKRKGGIKAYVKATITTGAPIVASLVLNAALKSIVMAMRDDDEDESYAEKYLEHFFGDFKDSLNPLTMVPYIKDVVSIFNGYDVERMDMALFSDLKNAVDAFDSDSKTDYEKWSGLIGAISAFFGLPVKNVERDIRGAINTFFGDTENTTAAGLLNAMEEGWTGESKSNGQQLYEAMLNGDKDQVKRVEGRFKDQSAINTAIRKALRENDPRIKEAAAARMKGDISGYMRIAKSIIAEGHFSQDNVVAAINAEISAMSKGESTSSTTDKESSLFKMEDYYAAIVGRDQATAAAVKEDVIRTAVKNGKDREEAEANFVSSFVTHLGNKYEEGKLSDREAESMLVKYADKSEEEAESKVQHWAFKQEYPDYDLSEEAVTKYYSDVKPSGIGIKVYYDYSKGRAKCKGTDTDGDGKTDSGSVKREVLMVIHSLPISASQKDALYFAEGWAASTLHEAPWR